MNLGEFLLAPTNVPFAVALGVVALLGIVEVAGIFLGSSSLADTDTDADAGVEGVGFAPRLLNFLHFGALPSTVLLLLFCLGFSLSGYAIQYGLWQATGRMAPAFLVAVGAFFLAIPLVRVGGVGLRKTLFREDTAALSSDALIGRMGVITLGETRVGMPSQAKLKDEFGTTHYVQVEPLHAGGVYAAGAEVILVSRAGATYQIVGVDDTIDQLTAADASSGTDAPDPSPSTPR
jgi:hypothetical protein